MKKRWTPEERRAWEERCDARQRELQEHIERIAKELGVRPEDLDAQQLLEERIARITAELEAKKKPA